MGYTIDELWESRQSSGRRRNSQQVREYYVEWDGAGSTDEDAVISAIRSSAPTSVTLDSTLLSEVQVEVKILVPDDKYMATVTYVSPDSNRANRDRNQENPPPEKELTAGSTEEIERLEYSGERETVYHAYEQFKVGAGGTGGAPEAAVGNAIDIINGVPRGTERLVPFGTYSIQRAYNMPISSGEKTTFKTWLDDWTGRYAKVNSATWRDFDAYSARFDRLEFNTREDGALLGSFQFSIRPTRTVTLPYETNFSTGAISTASTSVQGWAHVWTRYRDAKIPGTGTDTDRLWAFPEATYYARIYEALAFDDTWFDETW